MTSRFTDKNLYTNQIILELLHFLENLKFQPYVSNTSAALMCFLIDNTAMLYVFFVSSLSVHLNISVFKNLNSLNEIHVREIRKETRRSV